MPHLPRVVIPDHPLVTRSYLSDEIPDWAQYLREGNGQEFSESEIEKRLTTGRPLGPETFIQKIQAMTNIDFVVKKVGRPKLPQPAELKELIRNNQ